MPRKPKNPENLFQRNGVWQIRYHVAGRKIVRSLDTTSVREAKQLRDEILGKRAGLADVREKFGIEVSAEAAPAPTVREVGELYLKACDARESAKGYRRETLRPQTIREYRGYLSNWVYPEFGNKPLSAIRCEDVERFVARLRRELGENSIPSVFRALRRLFRFAMRRRLYIGADPTDIENKPSNARPRDVVLTADEAQALLGHLKGQLYWQSCVALLAGLRWGEVCGLKWEDVRLDAATPQLQCRRSYQGPLKNEAAGAPIPINTRLTSVLRQWKLQCPSKEWIFPSRYGVGRKRMSGADRITLSEAADAVEITKHVTPHVFRHTFGSLLYEAVEDPKAVQRLMRHASIKTTMEVYVKDTRALQDKIEALPELVPGVKLALV